MNQPLTPQQRLARAEAITRLVLAGIYYVLVVALGAFLLGGSAGLLLAAVGGGVLLSWAIVAAVAEAERRYGR